MRKRDILVTVWFLLCAVLPATQIEWTGAVIGFASLIGFAGLNFGLAVGGVGSARAAAYLAKLKNDLDFSEPRYRPRKGNNMASLKVKSRRAIILPEEFPRIVCLCGSTRFMDAFHNVGWQLTLAGYIVLTVGVCKHAKNHGGEALGQDVADKLDKLHFRKIDLADWVMVLNVDGYIGESTQREIGYALSQGKTVTYTLNEQI